MKKLILLIIFALVCGNSYSQTGVSDTAPYLGQFATRTNTEAAVLASGVATQQITKTRHFARAEVNGFYVAFPNWYINSSQAETGNGGTATITAAIEYPIGGTITQVTWAGSASTTAASGAQTALSDLIKVHIPAGDAFIVRAFYENASGTVVYQSSGENALDAANGEEYRYGKGTLTDQTMVAGAYSGGLGTSTTNNWGPILLVGYINTPSICILGDSRQSGIDDTYVGDSSTNKGAISRAVGPYYPYINTGRANSQASNYISASPLQRALCAYTSHIISGYGYNDLSTGGVSVATLEGRITTICGYFSGKPCFQTTIPPRSTSTDSWATLVNQTIGSKNTEIHDFNDSVRSLSISGVSGYFEFADIAEGTRDSGKWVVTGAANYATSDGIHESQAMNILYRTNNAVDPKKIQR